MLDNGRFPRVFTWKEALLEYLNHLKFSSEYHKNKNQIKKWAKALNQHFFQMSVWLPSKLERPALPET